MHIIAHRGYSFLFPENTLLAFDEAVKAGAWMIETDIRLSADEVPMIFHDSSLMRVCGKAKGVEELSSTVLSAIDVSGYVDERLPTQFLPTLEETLLSIHGKIGMILEMKYHPSTSEKIARVVEPMIRDRLEWLEVSSFSDAILHDFYVLNPSIRLHKLIEEAEVLEREDFDEAYGYIYAFDIDIALLSHPKTQTLLMTKKVIFWTVEDQNPKEFEKAYGAMSNDPLALRTSCLKAGL